MKKRLPTENNEQQRKPKLSFRPRLLMKQKMIFAAGILIVLATISIALYFQFTNVKTAHATASGSYRAVATGNWSTVATWQKYNGSTWAAATTAPSTGAAIEIQSPYTVTVSSAVTANGITIDAGATLSVSSGQTLTVSHNSGTDLAVNGTLTVAGTMNLSASASVAIAGTFNMSGTTTATSPATIAVSGTTTVSGGTLTINSGATFTFNSGGTLNHTGGTITISGTLTMNSGATYIHAMNGGTVPTATWNSGSNVQITGMTSTYPSGMGQSFSNLTFKSGLLSNIEMTSSLSVGGNLNLSGSGVDILYLSNSSTSRTITVGGNLNDSSGTFIGANSTGTGTITVTGNLNMVGGTFTATNGGGAGTVNVTGILNMSSGTFNDVNSSGAGTVNVTSDFDLSGGTFNLKNGSGTAALNVTGNMNTTGGTLYERALNITSTGTITVTGNFSLTAGTIDLTDILSTGTLNVAGNFTHTGGTLTAGLLATGSVVFNGSGLQTYTSGGTVSGIINFTVNNGSTLVMGTNVLGSGSSGTFTLSSGAGIQIGSTAGITSSGSTGNIQVSGARSYNAGATYTYNGTAAQSTGNGLPSTLANFTVNNSNGLTLSSNLTISNTLTFTSGTITTGSNTLSVTNTSNTAITGFSSSSYVIGNLKLSISSTPLSSGYPEYPFPLGTSTNYELLYFAPENTAGFTTVTGTFTNANPINSSYPLNDSVSGAAIDSMLNYGYWTLTPNSTMTSGAIDVKISQTGFTGTISGSNVYTVITRANSSSSWTPNGNTQAATYANGALTANETGISSFGDFGIGYGVGPPILAFNNHTLISGTDMAVGATYLFQDVGIGLDAWIQITDFQNGGSVSDIDNWTYPNGYDDAWQPFVNNTANDTSSVGWKIMFKVAGTSTDTALANLTFAAIDVDGDDGTISEFVEAYQPSSISYAATTLLTYVNKGGNMFAYGPIANIPNIDTSQTQGVFKVNYKNVSSFQYRTGVIARSNTIEVRQASLYFKTLTLTNPTTVLPVSLLYFTPKINSDYVDLTWATASEINNDYFTVERSSNGIDFEELLKKPGSGTTTTMHNYSAFDENPLQGISYYRLKQTDFNGHFTYSPIEPIEYGVTIGTNNVSIATIGPNPFKDNFSINYNVAQKGNVEIQIVDNAGHFINTETVVADKGFNTYLYYDHANLPSGIYIVTVISNGEAVTKKIIKQ